MRTSSAVVSGCLWRAFHVRRACVQGRIQAEFEDFLLVGFVIIKCPGTLA